MPARDLQYPLGILAIGIVLGAAGGGFAVNPAWPVVIVLAAVVLAALALHVRSVRDATENDPNGKVVAAQGRSSLVAGALVICGFAFLLGTCAPDLHSGKNGTFGLWFGWAVVSMGLALTYAVSLAGGRIGRREVTVVRSRREQA